MKRFVKIGIMSLATAVVLFASCRNILAQGDKLSSHAPTPTTHAVPQTSETITNATPHFLLATFLTQGEPSTSEAGGIYPSIDTPTTFFCPNKTCTLVITQNVQVNGGDASGNAWAIGCNLDSNIDACPGYYQGETDVDGTYSTGTELSTLSVTHGSHTVYSWIYSWYGLTLSYYNISYQLYIP